MSSTRPGSSGAERPPPERERKGQLLWGLGSPLMACGLELRWCCFCAAVEGSCQSPCSTRAHVLRVTAAQYFACLVRVLLMSTVQRTDGLPCTSNGHSKNYFCSSEFLLLCRAGACCRSQLPTSIVQSICAQYLAVSAARGHGGAQVRPFGSGNRAAVHPFHLAPL